MCTFVAECFLEIPSSSGNLKGSKESTKRPGISYLWSSQPSECPELWSCASYERLRKILEDS